MSGLWEVDVPVLEDFQNECTNPSWETDGTGWTTGGANTLAQSPDRAWRGFYSGKVTVGDNATLASISPTLLLTSTTYYLKFRVWVSANWDGGNITIVTSGFTGASDTDVKIYTHGTSPTAEWIELKSTLPVAADPSGTIALVSQSVATAGRVVYFDAVLFSPFDVTYFDGETPGAEWDGLRYKSTSTMDGQNRSCGVPTNLDAFATHVTGNVAGVNFLPQRHSAQPFARLPGAIYQYTSKNVRSIILPTSIIGASLTNLHSSRKGLFNALKNMYHGQPFTLRYNGADAYRQVEIEVRLDDAPTRRLGFTDETGLRFVSHTDPFFRGMGDNTATLDHSDSLSVASILGFIDGAFDNMGGDDGTGNAETIAIDQNGDVYIGGQFDNWASIANADRIAYYDLSAGTWNALSTGANGNVSKILFTPDGTLWVAGNFTTIGGVAANRVATWNGTTFSALGTGMNGIVRTMAYNPTDGMVYFGGAFTTANGVTVNYVTRWNGTTFEALDSGVNLDLFSMIIHPGTGDVYIGGSFTTMGAAATAVKRVARWDLSEAAWHLVSPKTGGGFDGNVRALAFDSAFNLYAGGEFTDVDSVSVNYLAVYNNSKWQDVGGGVTLTGSTPSVMSLTWKPTLNRLLVTGTFDGAGGLTVNNVVEWNGSAFQSLPFEFPASSLVNGYAQSGRNYYYVFSTAGTIQLPGLANSVTNDGTDEAYPILVIENTSASVVDIARFERLENLTTGKVILSDFHGLTKKTRLLVDLRPGQKQVLLEFINQGIIEKVTGQAVLPGSNFGTWSLVPGVNKILLRVSDYQGTPTINAYLIWRDRYEFIDGIADDL